MISKYKVCEIRRKVVNWPVEVKTCNQLSKCGRKKFDRLIEMFHGKMGDSVGEE